MGATIRSQIRAPGQRSFWLAAAALIVVAGLLVAFRMSIQPRDLFDDRGARACNRLPRRGRPCRSTREPHPVLPAVAAAAALRSVRSRDAVFGPAGRRVLSRRRLGAHAVRLSLRPLDARRTLGGPRSALRPRGPGARRARVRDPAPREASNPGGPPPALAFAIGVSVSAAQYLSTLFAGGGRVSTLTTEALALADGGDRRLSAIVGLAQTLFPFAVYATALAGPRILHGKRRGLVDP